MRYTKGAQGPASSHNVEIVDHRIGNGNIVHAYAIVETSKGSRGINLMAQGKHADALQQHMAQSARMRLKMRWTGREAATMIGTA